jgi:dephospho-CoA kinase
MKKKTVIAIIGEQASGKGAAADFIRKKYGGQRLTISNLLRRTLDSLYIPTTRENLINLALVLKKGFGNDVLMRAMLKEVEQEDTDLVIVDGLRMPGDPDPFREEYDGNFYLIYVTADQEIRYKRSVNRGEKVGESDAAFEEFQANEQLDTEKSIPEVGATADFKIENNGTAEELEKKVLDIMSKI